MKDVLLVKYGEIALRGKNRFIYENMLIRALYKNLDKIGSFDVRKEQGRLLIIPVDGDIGAAADAAVNVFGLVAVCPCVMTENQDIGNLKYIALKYLRKHYPNGNFTFKAETSRSDKRYPLTSMEVSALVGEHILENMEDARVSMKNPDVLLKIELRNNAYIYSDSLTRSANGGLPPGSSGSAVLLLSGGIDSPVAGYLAAKRGIELIAVYFHSPPYTSERAKEKVKDLAERLSVFTGKIKLYVVSFTELQLKLCDRIPPEKLTIMLKRSMLKTAQRLAKVTGASALITGDSIGQVASQTMSSIVAVDPAATIPVIRPLVCMDKCEIVDLAQKIGTFDISVRPYEDCCTLFLPKHPETKPSLKIIESLESRVEDLPELIEKCVSTAELIEF